jgi:uncharacterized protein YjbJ (UPF0337 family)
MLGSARRAPYPENPDLEADGTGEKVAGKVQKKIGELEKVVGLP